MKYTINMPEDKLLLQKLKAGDTVSLSGIIYTARDAAHQRMAQLIKNGEELPFKLEGAIIYYAGPTPTPNGQVVGSIGPTTAGRMDSVAPLLLKKGLAAMVGKGARTAKVLQTMKETNSVYLGFVGGAGALAAKAVESCEIIAWEDLGSEAVRKLCVKNFPLTVIADAFGGNLYESGPCEYLASIDK